MDRDSVLHEMIGSYKEELMAVQAREKRLLIIIEEMEAKIGKPVKIEHGDAMNLDGLNRPQAVRVILSHFNRPMRTAELLKVFDEHEMPVKGEDLKAKKANLYGSLLRSHDVEKTPDGLWVLPTWDSEKKEIEQN